MASRPETGDPSRPDDGSMAGRHRARGRGEHEAPGRLEGSSTTLRAAFGSGGLFMADAESQIPWRWLLLAGTSLGVHADDRRCRGFVRLNIGSPAGIQGGTAINR